MSEPGAGPRVYIHEFIDVVGTERSRYQHHMTANWCPDAATYRRQRCFGVFTLVGSTGRWPEVVNLWEFDSFDDLAHDLSVELSGPAHRDPVLEQWWSVAAEFRRGGTDRILVAHDAMPPVDHWYPSGTGSVAYMHEVLRGAPGGAAGLADGIAAAASALDERFGFGLVGLFCTAMRNDDEVIAIHSVPNWDSWAAFESASSPALGGAVLPDVVSRERVLLVDAELSPLRIGRQPLESDRRPLDQV